MRPTACEPNHLHSDVEKWRQSIASRATGNLLIRDKPDHRNDCQHQPPGSRTSNAPPTPRTGLVLDIIQYYVINVMPRQRRRSSCRPSRNIRALLVAAAPATARNARRFPRISVNNDRRSQLSMQITGHRQNGNGDRGGGGEQHTTNSWPRLRCKARAPNGRSACRHSMTSSNTRQSISAPTERRSADDIAMCQTTF
jgi:hypothetical protein